MNMIRVDLNCDMGESSEPQRMLIEERVLPYVSSINIACGFHAGNPALMQRLVGLAQRHGVAIGAHPGLRDPEGMGRREIVVERQKVQNLLAYQVGALAGIATLERVTLAHVKLHGALYNMTARDPKLAEAVASGVAAIDRRLLLYALAGSALVEAAKNLGVQVVQEAFADRAYQRDGSLVPRTELGAVITDERVVVDRVLRMVREGKVRSIDGVDISLRPDTVCLHADTEGADRLARRIRQAVEAAGIRVGAPSVVHATT